MVKTKSNAGWWMVKKFGSVQRAMRCTDGAMRWEKWHSIQLRMINKYNTHTHKRADKQLRAAKTGRKRNDRSPSNTKHNKTNDRYMAMASIKKKRLYSGFCLSFVVTKNQTTNSKIRNILTFSLFSWSSHMRWIDLTAHTASIHEHVVHHQTEEKYYQKTKQQNR